MKPVSVFFKLLRSPLAAWPLFIFYTAALFYFSLLPGNEIPKILLDLHDKLIHAMGYAVLMAVSAHAFYMSGNKILSPRPYFWGAWYSANISVITEGLQHFVPGRFTDPLDLAANTLGIIISLALLLKIQPDKRLQQG